MAVGACMFGECAGGDFGSMIAAAHLCIRVELRGGKNIESESQLS